MNITPLVKTLSLLTVCNLISTKAITQTYLSEERESLRGIEAFKVETFIQKVDSEIHQRGLTKSQLKTDVELRFRTAGIKVLTKNDLSQNGSMDYPFLLVYVQIIPAKLSEVTLGYAYSIDLSFYQNIILYREPSIAIRAITWNISYTGIAPYETSIRSIRENVINLVDTFMNGYLAVNPKR